MSYRIEALADDCYPGTSCLINKYDIRDEKQLSFVESRIVIGKTEELLRNPIPGKFNFTHYKSIHRFLFEDIYEWAGKVRTIDISKKGTDFTKASNIEEMAGRIFARLGCMNNFIGLNHGEFVDEITDFYCSTYVTSIS